MYLEVEELERGDCSSARVPSTICMAWEREVGWEGKLKFVEADILMVVDLLVVGSVWLTSSGGDDSMEMSFQMVYS